jgi:hypothetical protein
MANRLLPERVHDRCLANASFTRYENHLSLAGQCILQTIVQLVQSRLAPHYVSQTLSRRIQTGRSAVVPQGSYKLVTPLRERRNKCRALGLIAQYLADLQDILSNAFRIDIGIWPERLKELVPRDQPVCVLDQVAQQVERLRRKGHARFLTPQTMVDRVEPEGLEYFHFRQAPSSNQRRNKPFTIVTAPAGVRFANRIRAVMKR